MRPIGTALAAPSNMAGAFREIAVVTRQPDDPALLESIGLLPTDVVFTLLPRKAYGEIAWMQPDLIIVCLDLDDPDTFQVLTMLQLDETTKGIPIVARVFGASLPVEPRRADAPVPVALPVH